MSRVCSIGSLLLLNECDEDELRHERRLGYHFKTHFLTDDDVESEGDFREAIDAHAACDCDEGQVCLKCQGLTCELHEEEVVVQCLPSRIRSLPEMIRRTMRDLKEFIIDGVTFLKFSISLDALWDFAERMNLCY